MLVLLLLLQLLLLLVEVVKVDVVVLVLVVLLLLLAAVVLEGLAVEEVAVPVLLAMEARAPGSLSMVPSALLTFDPLLF